MPAKNINIDTRSNGFFAALALVALLFAWTAVGPCLDNGFINWDETRYILDNPKIKTLTPGSAAAVFTSRDLGMYSPLATLSYAVNYHFSGLSPRAYHATDIALHLVNTALVMLLVRLLLPGVWAAFLCGLFFGVHPAHIESVAWAAERKDLLYAAFYLLSLCAYALSLRRRKEKDGAAGGGTWNKEYFAAFALFACSLLAKPMAVTLPLALLLMDYLKLESVGRKEWLNKTPFFAAAALFSAVALQPAAGPEAHWIPLASRLPVAVYNLGFYIYTLVWPFNLSAMYVLPPGGMKAVYIIAACTAAAGGLLWKYRRRDKAFMFGAGLYIALLLPVLQLFPFGPVVSADRYTYLSALGIFIGLCAAGAGAWARAGAALRKAMVLAVILVAITFTVAARLRCAVWKDSVSLWSDTLRKQPAAGQALIGLCAGYLQAGMAAPAEACLAEAIRRYPDKDDNYSNMGMLRAGRGDFAAAQRYFERALELNGRNGITLYSLGNLARIKGDAAAAEKFYLRSADCEGVYTPALRSLGDLAAARKDTAAALLYYERALAENPADVKASERAAALRRR